MSKMVTLVWIGGKHRNDIQPRYIGDGLMCHLDYPDTCAVTVSPEKALQLLKDMPERWEVKKTSKEFDETFSAYKNRMAKPEKIKTTIPEKAFEVDPNYNWRLEDLEAWAKKHKIEPEEDIKGYKELKLKTHKKSALWRLIKEKLN